MNDGLVRTLLALTFVTGIVDAVAFIGLGQVFAAMQTGNVLFLGFGLGDAAGAPVIAPLVGLGAFIGGGFLAASLASGRAARGAAVLAVALPVEVALLAAAALFAALVDVTPDELSAYLLIGALSLAMGIRTTTARSAGEENVATTVLNLSMASLASPSGLVAGRDVAERGLALVAILCGALCGALLLKASVEVAIATAAALTLGVRVALAPG
jgi:uncharacterized membrane protein YoaK (UPF0700 family)